MIRTNRVPVARGDPEKAGKPGGHRSFAGLVQAAVEREVQRLAEEFNDGQPYESHQGEFRRGRPFS